MPVSANEKRVTELRATWRGVSRPDRGGGWVQGATRGQGLGGEDATGSRRTGSSIPLPLPGPVTGRLGGRGEVYLPTASFAATNKERAERGEPLFANPRNAAAGAVRQLDPQATAKRNLAMWSYSAPGLEVASHEHLLDPLRKPGPR